MLHASDTANNFRPEPEGHYSLSREAREVDFLLARQSVSMLLRDRAKELLEVTKTQIFLHIDFLLLIRLSAVSLLSALLPLLTCTFREATGRQLQDLDPTPWASPLTF